MLSEANHLARIQPQSRSLAALLRTQKLAASLLGARQRDEAISSWVAATPHRYGPSIARAGDCFAPLAMTAKGVFCSERVLSCGMAVSG